MLRRSVPWERVAVSSAKGVQLNVQTRSARLAGALLDLTGGESDLLRLLMQAKGEAVPRETLSRGVLDREYSILDWGIDNFVSSLRKKLGPTPEGLERIKTIRNVGYVFASPDTVCGD